MSKELEALCRMKNTLLAEGYWQDTLQDIAVIEAALKEYEKIKDVRITARFDLNQVSKEHRALEIIKEKEVDIHNLLISKTAEQYNGYTHWLGCKGNLTQEEFDSLKEVLS